MENSTAVSDTMEQNRTAARSQREARFSPACTKLLDALRQKTAKVGVIGLGYVGLPLANLFHQKGFRVVGFDIGARLHLRVLRKGRCR